MPHVGWHRLWLTFDDTDSERAYRTAHDEDAVPTARMAAVLGIALYAAFAILDTQTAARGLPALLIMRGLVIAWLVVIIVLSYRDWFPRHLQLAVCSSVLAGGLGMASMPAIADVPEAMPAMGAMLTLIFLFSFVRARILPALATAGLVIGAFETTLLISGPGTLTVVYLNFELLGFVVAGVAACHTLEKLWRRDFLRARQLQSERERSDALLHNVLPETIARRLRLDQRAIAESVPRVSVLFADIVGFTPLTERVEPERLLSLLDELFGCFDGLCDRYGVEKIKTIGDGYMAVAGVPDPHPDPAGAVVSVALGMRAEAAKAGHGVGPLGVRLGICTGPALVGVIGRRRFAYDLWGDAVNTASRLESHGRPGSIYVCAATRALLGDRHPLQGPMTLDLKGKGPVEAWEVAPVAPVSPL